MDGTRAMAAVARSAVAGHGADGETAGPTTTGPGPPLPGRFLPRRPLEPGGPAARGSASTPHPAPSRADRPDDRVAG
ncbi:hypothetical protein [Streptomyces sp. NPDC048106]|uniref:hypothetical protein n=1 Tax=Streptomyces sp. NPDC048106 TaxID=3155750 RepID=UPI0034529271